MMGQSPALFGDQEPPSPPGPSGAELTAGSLPQGYERIYAGPSQIDGTGIFAAQDIKAGESIFRRNHERIINDDHPLRPEFGEFDWHTDDIAGGRVVYLPYPERHSNHSCDPNSYDRIIDGVTYRFALKDIAKDEEITTDYCINAPMSEGVLDCSCGAARCRGRVIHGFFALPLDLQIEYLPLLLPWFVDENREAIDRLRAQAAAARR